MTAAAEGTSTSDSASANAGTLETKAISGLPTSLRRYRVQHHHDEQKRQIEHGGLQQLTRALLRYRSGNRRVKRGETDAHVKQRKPHRQRSHEVDSPGHPHERGSQRYR